MRAVPEIITRAWIETLSDADLVDVEQKVQARFALAERREKKLRGAKYALNRGSAELLSAWDKWSRVSYAMRERMLKPRRVVAGAEA